MFLICFVLFVLIIFKIWILYIFLFCCSKLKEMVSNMDGIWLIEIVLWEIGKYEFYVIVDGWLIKVCGLFEIVCWWVIVICCIKIVFVIKWLV